MGGSGGCCLLQPGATAPQHFQQTGVASGPRILGEYNPCHSTLHSDVLLRREKKERAKCFLSHLHWRTKFAKEICGLIFSDKGELSAIINER